MNLFSSLASQPSRSKESADDNANGFRYTVKPAYVLQENAEAWGLTVQLPGVAKESLDISAEEGRLVIRGPRSWKKPEAWAPLHREAPEGDYELILAHDNVVDAEKIHAELRNGILRVSLPKAEAVKPRKISVG